MRLARCRLYLGDPAGCRDLAGEVIAADPSQPWGYVLKGAALAFLGAQEEADANLAAAREKGRGLPNVTLRLAAIHLLLKRWPQAETLFRELLAIRPNSAPAYEGPGCALQGQGGKDLLERIDRALAA